MSLKSSLLWKQARAIKSLGPCRTYYHTSSSTFDQTVSTNISLYGLEKEGNLDTARKMFDEMTRRTVVSWNTMISGYSNSGNYEEDCTSALELFRLMRACGKVMPNEFTLDCVLRACCRLGVLDIGRSVHGTVTKFAFELDHSIGSALIELYCHCDAIDDAQKVYKGMDHPCLNSSNALIRGLILLKRINDAELIFSGMSEKDPVSYNLMIKGYAMSSRIEDSKNLFEKMPLRTIISSNTMISVYFRNGEIDKALGLFNETKGERNPVTWNSMISGYVQNGQCEEALRLYAMMCRLSIDQTTSTFSILFNACSFIGHLQLGKLIHACVEKTPFKFNVYVRTSLVDMYSKCGSICDARASFKGIDSPNVVAWTALINGYAHHGLTSEAVIAFEHMVKDGVKPNSATFVGMLSACARDGLVTTGMRCFYSMEKFYGVTPTVEHYACMVDLLGRSGHLREAEDLIQEMPVKADGVVWGALLSACWYWMDMAVGKRVAEKMFTMDPLPVSAYIIMSNIYAGLGRWAEKMEVRKRLKDLTIKKDPGCSWIELNNSVHVFCIEDKTRLQNSVIYSTLEHLISNIN